jgi:hypothetical protein
MLNNLPPLAPFRPRLLSDLRGYNREKLVRDVGAGATVGIVALPLAMAFAIASGLKPEAGLWTAIIAGFLISALGGTSVQIGGPAGAFIVIVYGIVERYGVANLLIATASAGVLLFLLGLFRLGTLVRYVPVSVVIGFTNGIAVLIALSQVRDWLGLDIDKMPGDFFKQIVTIAQHIDSFNPYAFMLGLLCVVGLFIWPRLWAVDSQFRRQLEQVDTISALKATSRLPAPVVALITLSLLAWLLNMPVDTIGTRFGGIPQGLPVRWRCPIFLGNRQAAGHPHPDHCPAGRHRVAAVRPRGRPAQRPPQTRPQPGADGPGRGQLRGTVFRRHARHRHHRSHGDQHPLGRRLAGRRHGACRHAGRRGAAGGTAGAAHPAGGAGRRAAVRGLEHGRMARVRASSSSPATTG